jgi:hypothetical protein
MFPDFSEWIMGELRQQPQNLQRFQVFLGELWDLCGKGSLARHFSRFSERQVECQSLSVGIIPPIFVSEQLHAWQKNLPATKSAKLS